ncbi:alpha-crystallin A chain-like [Argiope bruennichi]|uniref:alpha-crystallin A chain-like n=1 Tax=Argiope bruennichi TaxID=94029 RepID=UPI002494DA5D|nr:alpha-crystallin A chain-like [Argiope bruennichi]
MALLPWISRSWWDPWEYPSRVFDPFFGLRSYDSEFLPPTLYHGLVQPGLDIDSSYLSEVKNDPDLFKVMVNVSHFKPEEIEVKIKDDSVVIHAKHEEKTDQHGFVSREFTRRYMLPEGTEADNVKSSLSPNGILTIEAPKKTVEELPSNERVVPITVEKPGFGSRLKKWFGFGK